MSMKKMLAVVAAAACVAFAAPAFAANPFSDVPMHHWAYDAVEVLASHGVIQGYPDGTFKGNKPITRYEMSMMIARAMGAGALSGEDSALLKKLIVEFKDELDSLGVRVDNLEGRMNGLEAGLNGWNFNGQLRLKATFSTSKKDRGFYFDRWWLNMSRDLSDKVKFSARMVADDDLATLKFSKFAVTVKDFFFGSELTAGKFGFDWEDDDGLYYWDAYKAAGSVLGLKLDKEFGMGSVSLLASTKASKEHGVGKGDFVFGARVKVNPSDRFWASIDGLWNFRDNVSDYVFAGGANVIDGVAVKGAFYLQKPKDKVANKAAKIVLDIDKSRLGGYSSLWVEYAQASSHYNGFAYPAYEEGKFVDGRRHSIMIGADQDWNDKISSHVFYNRVWDKKTIGNAFEIGAEYKYSANLKFGLDYDYTVFSQKDEKGSSKADHGLTFSTTFTF